MCLTLAIVISGCADKENGLDNDPIYSISDEKIAYVDVQDSGIYAVSGSGKFFAWGWNGYGKIGTGLPEDESFNITKPTHIYIPEKVYYVESGSTFACALTTEHELYGWGSNFYKELTRPEGDNYYNPILIDLSESVNEISVGSAHVLALGESGMLYSWGYNEYYALGDGSNTNRYTPIALDIPEKVVWVEAGTGVGYAMTELGILYG